MAVSSFGAEYIDETVIWSWFEIVVLVTQLSLVFVTRDVLNPNISFKKL